MNLFSTKGSVILKWMSLIALTLSFGCQHTPKSKLTQSPEQRRKIANTQFPDSTWNEYGGIRNDLHMGEKYSPLNQISKSGFKGLKKLWQYNTGEAGIEGPKSLEVTPVFHNNRIYGCTIFNKVFALDAARGTVVWEQPEVPEGQVSIRTSEKVWAYKCRGVALWTDSRAKGEMCRTTVFTNTIDGRLLAYDADTGRPCPNFRERGNGKTKGLPKDTLKYGQEVTGLPAGQVQPWVNVASPSYSGADRLAMLRTGKDPRNREKDHPSRDEFYMTSAPLIFKDLVIVGGGIADNGRVEATAGAIQAYDPRTGQLKWMWDPMPRQRTDQLEASTGRPAHYGTPNAWAPMSADESLGLVFVPTGSAAPDYYARLRDGKDQYANSIVALRVADEGGQLRTTPIVEWQFKSVIEDKWDYDVASQPVLTTFDIDTIKVVKAKTKTKRPGGVWVGDSKNGFGFTYEEFAINQKDVPVLLFGTKMGFVFMVHRKTGQPIYPTADGYITGKYSDFLVKVPGREPNGPDGKPSRSGIVESETILTAEELKTDAGNCNAETLSRFECLTFFGYHTRSPGSHSEVQPFPPKAWDLHGSPESKDKLTGMAAGFMPTCKAMTAAHDYNGMYTPPSYAGAIQFPGAVGGIDWGGITVDPVNKILYTNQVRIATIAKMFLKESQEYKDMMTAMAADPHKPKAFKEAYFEMEGTPFALHRFPYMDPDTRLPCTDPAYGILKAVSLKDGSQQWEKIFGTFSEMVAVINEQKAQEKAQVGELASNEKPTMNPKMLEKIIAKLPAALQQKVADLKANIPPEQLMKTSIADLIEMGVIGGDAVSKPGVQRALAAIKDEHKATLLRTTLGQFLETAKTDPEKVKQFFFAIFNDIHNLSAGVPNFGGSLVTDGGLLFIAGAADSRFRIYDAATGSNGQGENEPKLAGELAVVNLNDPQYINAGAGAATPMTYMTKVNGVDTQVIVLAAGGNKFIPGKQGDAIIAFVAE